jgi:hypothetical protein
MNHSFGTWLKLFPDTAQLEIPNLKKTKLYHFVEIEEHFTIRLPMQIYYVVNLDTITFLKIGKFLKNKDFSYNVVLHYGETIFKISIY